jgi:hypothetical protein
MIGWIVEKISNWGWRMTWRRFCTVTTTTRVDARCAPGRQRKTARRHQAPRAALRRALCKGTRVASVPSSRPRSSPSSATPGACRPPSRRALRQPGHHRARVRHPPARQAPVPAGLAGAALGRLRGRTVRRHRITTTTCSSRPLDANRAWIDTWNDDPKPYVWTKTADQILESIARYCTRINDSRH